MDCKLKAILFSFEYKFSVNLNHIYFFSKNFLWLCFVGDFKNFPLCSLLHNQISYVMMLVVGYRLIFRLGTVTCYGITVLMPVKEYRLCYWYVRLIVHDYSKSSHSVDCLFLYGI